MNELKKKEIDDFIEEHTKNTGVHLTPGGNGYYSQPRGGGKCGTAKCDNWYYRSGLYDEIEYCREWLQKYSYKRKTINNRVSSYSMKHIVESKAHEDGMCDGYITNGSFIVAALMEGYAMDSIYEYNPHFNMNFYDDGVTPAYRNRGYGEKSRKPM